MNELLLIRSFLLNVKIQELKEQMINNLNKAYSHDNNLTILVIRKV